MSRKVSIPPLVLRGAFKPDSVDAEQRTAVLRWTTGARVRREPLFSEPFNEELAVDGEAVRLERLKAGAPLLDSHSNRSVRDQIGVVEDAWIEDGEGLARVRFSGRDDVEPIFQDVLSGVIRNVSVGYRVHRFKDVSGEEDKIKTFRAVDWEPMELSLVPIPADPGASVRSDEETNECEIVPRAERETTMPETINHDVDGQRNRAHPIDREKVEQEARESERKRISEISELTRKFGIDEDFSRKLVADGVDVAMARSLILDKLAERSKEQDIAGHSPAVEIVRDEVATRREGMEEALLHRYNANVFAITDKGKRYASMSLLRLAEECLTRSGVRIDGFGKNQIAERALNSTDDFPLILANVANKSLRQGYEAAPQSFRPFVRETFLPDFKPASRVQLSEAPKLEKVNQSGEFKYGALGENQEQYALATYGKITGITRQVIINDDLDAFTRLPTMYGRSAAELESDLVWAIFTANALMSDGVALFDAAHGNLGTPGAISETTLSEARKLMRTQTGLQVGADAQMVNVTARYLIVPAAQETTAQKQLGFINPAKDDDVNPFARAYDLIVEPRLDANSTNAWYMAADPAQIDTIELAYLQGQRGVYTETRQGFNIDGIEVKARLDVAAKAIDFRGLFKNAGV